MKAIYETTGRAREYNELAINLYTGCGHQCVYCYGPNVTHQNEDTWKNNPQPRKGIITQIQRDAEALAQKGEKRPVLLCFVTDPYQPIEEKHQLTRKAILLLRSYTLNAIVLTKAGPLATRDFDILRPGMDAFATTLTLTSDEESRKWEPYAGLPSERIANLKLAHEKGFHTWVSCEPVIDPDQTMELIKTTAEYVDLFKVGTMNYHEQGEKINWRKFAKDAKALLDSMGKPYYLKKDLRQYL